MRRWLCVLLMAPLLLTQCGGEDVTDLDVRFLLHPIGGYDITHLSCSFEARLIGGDEPITATVAWIWEGAVVWGGQWTFSDTDWEPVTATYEAKPGYVLNGEFWLKISWNNSEGEDHSVTSNHCVCYVSDESTIGQGGGTLSK
jgi:hypothetical protein